LIRRLSRRQEALPASLETPFPLCPALRSRADFLARPLRRFGVVPANVNTKTPPLTYFRDSMTRLYGSLPTLEDAISGRQPRLASGGWSVLSGQGGSRRVSQRLSGARYFRYRFSFRLGSSLGYERHPRLTGLWLAPHVFRLIYSALARWRQYLIGLSRRSRVI